MKSHICNFNNVSETEDKFRATTGLTVQSFSNLLEFSNPGKDNCNITFYETSSRLSRSCDEIRSPKSGPKPKLSSQDQLFFVVNDLVKKWICSFTFSLAFQNFKVNSYKVFDNIDEFFLFFSRCSPNLAFKRSNR